MTTVVLREGDGDVLEPGQSVVVRFVLFRGDNGVLLQSSWGEQPQPLPYTEDVFPPLFEGMDGMSVGERRRSFFRLSTRSSGSALRATPRTGSRPGRTS